MNLLFKLLLVIVLVSTAASLPLSKTYAHSQPEERLNFLIRELSKEIEFSWISGGSKRRPGRYVNFGITHEDKVNYIEELIIIADKAQVDGNKSQLTRIKLITLDLIEKYPNTIINKAIAQKLLHVLRDPYIIKKFFKHSEFLFEFIEVTFPALRQPLQKEILDITLLNDNYLHSQRYKRALIAILEHIGERNYRLGNDQVKDFLYKAGSSLSKKNKDFLITRAFAQHIIPNFQYHSQWHAWLDNISSTNSHNEYILNALIDSSQEKYLYLSEEETTKTLVQIMKDMRMENYTHDTKIQNLVLKVIESRLGDIQQSFMTKVLLENFYMRTKNYSIRQKILELYSRNSNGLSPSSLARRLKAKQLKTALMLKELSHKFYSNYYCNRHLL